MPASADPSLVRGPKAGLYERVPLTGKLRLPGGAKVAAALTRTPAGAFVVPARAGTEGALEVAGADVRYERSLMHDRLTVAGQTFDVAPNRRRAARELLALARLSSSQPARVIARSVTVERPGRRAEAWLAAALEEDEELLVWLPLPEAVALSSSWSDGEQAPAYLFVSDRRAAHVAIGELGDVTMVALDDPSTPRPTTDSEVAARCLALTDDDPASWPWRVAALNWVHRGEQPAFRARAAFLLRSLLASGHVLGPLTGFLLGDQLGLASPPTLADVDEALGALTRPRELAEWWQAFALPVDAGMLLIERAQTQGLRPATTLPLHEAVWEAATAAATPLEAARADLELAAHYAEAGRASDAEELVRTRLDTLPAARVDDFLPDVRPDLSEVRERALSLWASTTTSAPTRALTKLVQRAPLNAAYVGRLRDGGKGWAVDAAAEVEALLAAGGLAAPDPERPETSYEPHKLEPEEAAALEHPAGRRSGALGALQAYLAIAQEPDRSSLRAFCERLSSSEHPEATAALADAIHLLGAPTIDAFVSRGEKGVGVRAYEGTPPFLLVGGHHLTLGGPFFLAPRELRFAIATEVAHVRFKHRRMTPGEVWTGAWEKSRAGLDLLFTLLPAFKGWDIAEKLVKAVTLTRKAVGTVDKAARKKIREESVGVRLGDLVEAHRLMQLTADRAGLLLAGDLKSAVRAMFLLDPTLRAELPVTERHGLAATLLRRDADGELVAPDLLIRTSALIGFYVSGTYARLASAARTPASSSSPS